MTMAEQTQGIGFTVTEKAVVHALSQLKYPDVDLGITSAEICGREKVLLSHVARALNDLCARALIERLHTDSGVFYRLKKDSPITSPAPKQPKQVESDDWVKCNVEGCGHEFSDATAMNIHKTKKHPEVRERENAWSGKVVAVVADAPKPSEPADQQEIDDEAKGLRIDVELAEDALAKLSATVDLLRSVEECDECDLKYALSVLLADAVHQFIASGLEPNNNPTLRVLKDRKREGST